MIDGMRELVDEAEQTELEFDPINRNPHLYPAMPDGWDAWSWSTLRRDDNNRDAITWAEAWAENPGGSLVFAGETGVGKSCLAAAITNDLVRRNIDVSAWEWLDWRDTLLSVFRFDSADDAPAQFKLRMVRAQVLVIDDVSAEEQRQSVREMFEYVIQARWKANLATLVTTNASVDNWRKWSGRAYSRLSDRNRSLWVPISGPDRRRLPYADD